MFFLSNQSRIQTSKWKEFRRFYRKCNKNQWKDRFCHN